MVDRYTRGSDVLRLLASADGAVRAQLGEHKHELERLELAAREDVRRRGEQLMQLARHYLPKFDQEAVDGAFSEVRRELEKILTRKQRAEEDLQQEWDRSLDRRQRLQDDLDAVTEELDTLVLQREQLEEKLAEELEQSEVFQDLSKRAVWAEQELERNQQRVEESKQEAQEKLPAYQDSRLFQYLIKRGYGTPGYHKRGWTRRMDRWVAKLVDFDKAKRSYDFLQVTPELMEAEVDRRRLEFEELMREVDALQQEHSERLGLAKVLKQGMKVGKRRDSLLTKIDGEQDDLQRCEHQLEELAGPDNEFYRQAVDRMRQFLGGLHESALEAKARGTASTADDAIFAEVSWLNDRLEQAKRDADGVRRRQADLSRKRGDLLDLGRRFRTAEFDSHRSVFSAGYDPRPEIERLMRGDSSKERVWDDIKRHQRFLPNWVERRWEDRRDLSDSDFSYMMVKVLAEAAGAAMRHAADQHRRYNRGARPGHRRRGRFTRGRGF